MCGAGEYDPFTSKLLPIVSDLRVGDDLDSEQNRELRAALRDFKACDLNRYASIFRQFVISKLYSWKW